MSLPSVRKLYVHLFGHELQNSIVLQESWHVTERSNSFLFKHVTNFLSKQVHQAPLTSPHKLYSLQICESEVLFCFLMNQFKLFSCKDVNIFNMHFVSVSNLAKLNACMNHHCFQLHSQFVKLRLLFAPSPF